MTQEEFSKEWRKLHTKQRKFVLAYLETLDPKEAAIRANYNDRFVQSPKYRIMRRLQHIIDYLMAKNNIISNIVKPEFVLKEYLRIYEKTNSEITKQNILRELSKILQMQNEGNKVEIQNNIPAQPVQIVFSENEE
jgi:phage terminase small subunit